MAELKTQKTGASVDDFLNGLPKEQARKDCFENHEAGNTRRTEDVGQQHHRVWQATES